MKESRPASAGSDGWASVAEINCRRLDGEAGDLVRIRILVYDASGTNAGNYEIDRR